jgi:hypothetical protein
MLPFWSIVMSAIQAKRFNWLPAPTAWQQAKAARQKNRAMIRDFQNASLSMTSSFSSAWLNQIDGAAELAAKAALKRIQAMTSLVDKTV